MNIYVDDLRDCPKGFVIARTLKEAINLLQNNKVEILSLDHDLGIDKYGNILPSGYDLVKYFCQNNMYVEKIYIHTDNCVGRENMYRTLIGAQKRGFISDKIKIYNYPLTKNKYTIK